MDQNRDEHHVDGYGNQPHDRAGGWQRRLAEHAHPEAGNEPGDDQGNGGGDGAVKDQVAGAGDRAQGVGFAIQHGVAQVEEQGVEQGAAQEPQHRFGFVAQDKQQGQDQEHDNNHRAHRPFGIQAAEDGCIQGGLALGNVREPWGINVDYAGFLNCL